MARTAVAGPSGVSIPAAASSAPSSPNVCAASQHTVTEQPTGRTVARPVFCANAVSCRPDGSCTTYWVLVPVKLASVTRPPDSAFIPAGAVAPRSSCTFSGRTPTSTSRPADRHRSAGTAIRLPSTSTTTDAPVRSATAAGSRLDWPRKFATYAVAGDSYRSIGEPSCSIRPAFITAIVSAIVMASS